MQGVEGGCATEKKNLLCLSSLHIMSILKLSPVFVVFCMKIFNGLTVSLIPLSRVLGLLYSLYFEIRLLIYSCAAFQRVVLHSKVSIVVLAFSRTISIIIPLLKIISSN